MPGAPIHRVMLEHKNSISWRMQDERGNHFPNENLDIGILAVELYLGIVVDLQWHQEVGLR